MHKLSITVAVLSVLLFCFVPSSFSQTFGRELKIAPGGLIDVKNHFGKVEITVRPSAVIETASDEKLAGESSDNKVSFTASSSATIAERDLKIGSGEQIAIETAPSNTKTRIDISLVVPERSRLRIETLEGEVRVTGNLESVEIKTETGTIAADVPTDDLKYDLFWTASRPRFLSDFELEKVKERSRGRFEIKGRFSLAEEQRKKDLEAKLANGESSEPALPKPENSESSDDKKTKDERSKTVALNFTTARGIVILNVPANEVSSDLRERPLTNAAKAIIRSGDSLLMDAIRRASPKYFGDYTKTLPPFRREPAFSERAENGETPGAAVKQVRVRVTDQFNRTVSGLRPEDFEILENNEAKEILSVRPSTAPVNLVLLLDVSGSVDNYVNFIRKAARNFVETVSWNDRISIVTFNEDVKVLSGFSSNKEQLSKRLDSFDAGGGTAFYDSIAYTLTETLRPLKGERTAIVILTDGDDNRSFLSFDSLLGSIEESGALVYPLYVPSALVAASENSDPNALVDPLRSRYMNISIASKAGGEGERLAKVSGGIYYPITQLSQIQRAYDDIVLQLRTAYTITFRSNTAAVTGNRASPRVKVKVAKPNTFVSLGPVVTAPEN